MDADEGGREGVLRVLRRGWGRLDEPKRVWKTLNCEDMLIFLWSAYIERW